MKYFYLTILLWVSTASAQASDCVQVNIQSSALCEKLQVNFDSSECEVSEDIMISKVSCRNEFVAEVVGKSTEYQYVVVVTKNTDGTWVPGQIVRNKLPTEPKSKKSNRSSPSK
ncbi:MAG: hypothetical protein AB7F59_03705 [Bdellovibrionales bacterium]